MGIEHYPGEKRIAYPKEEPLDSFGRVRGSTPFNLFDIQFNYGLQPRLFEQFTVNGSVTHDPLSSGVILSTGGIDSGNTAIFQSKQYFRYLPGLAQQVVWTCVLGEGKNNVQKRIGLYDSEDGLGFMQNDSGLNVFCRTSTSGSSVDKVIPQSEWNLDKLDGTGPSGILLDITKDNIYIIDYQWLGAGRVRFGYDFSGHITYIHQIQYANTEVLPFMRTANLPFRVEIINTGITDSETEYNFNCLAINSGGGSEPAGLLGSTNNAIATGGTTQLRTVTSNTQPLPVISIRPCITFKTFTNRGQVKPQSYKVASKDSLIYYAIILNGTLTGSSFVDVNTDESIVQVDVSATDITGGIVIDSGYLGGEVGAHGMSEILSDLGELFLSNNIAGDTTDILSIVIGLADSINSDCAGTFTWKEIY